MHRNALDATSLFGFSGVTRHVQFFVLPALIPLEREVILSDRGVIFQKGVGCLWGKECLLLVLKKFSLCFMMCCADFVEIVCLPHRKKKGLCCSSVCKKTLFSMELYIS